MFYKKKSINMNFFSRNIFKKIFLFKKNALFRVTEKFFYERGAIVAKSYKKADIYIYNGKTWKKRVVNRWMVGFKLGEFTWNRKIALYKAKQRRKKKKK